MGCEGRHPKLAEIMDRYVSCSASSRMMRDVVRVAGKAYHIKDIINGRYYYPRDPGTYSEKARSHRYLTGPCQMVRGRYLKRLAL